jgi:hypothetical protein
MSNYERSKALLDNLGAPAARPSRPVREPSNGPCKNCSAYSVVWATLPSGSRVPLDRHPEGPLVLRNGLAVEAPPHEDEPRFCMHFDSCRQRQEGKQ